MVLSPALPRQVRLVLSLMVTAALALALASGVNWLSRQPWGSPGSVSFFCDPGQALHYRTLKDGDTLVSCR